jgi:hypothetical protein
VRVSAALICLATLSGSQLLAAQVAPDTFNPLDSQTSQLPSPVDLTFHPLDDPLVANDLNGVAPNDIVQVDQTSAAHRNLETERDPSPASTPTIALPPAVASGMGLLGILAACMMLRRFYVTPNLRARRN